MRKRLTEEQRRRRADQAIRRTYSRTKWSDLYNAFDDYLQLHGIKARSRRNYSGTLPEIESATSKDPRKWTRQDAEDFQRWLTQDREPTLAKTTVRQKKILIASFLHWCQSGGPGGNYDDSAPDPPVVVAFRNSKRHRGRSNGNGNTPRPMDVDTARKVLDSAQNPRDRAFFHFLLDSGARAGEAVNLKIGSLKKEMGDTYATIPQEKGQDGEERTVVLGPSVSDMMEWLQMHPHRDDPQAPLWLTSWGTPMAYSTARSAWNAMRKNYREKYGHGLPRKFTMHSLRHTAATWAASHASYAQMCKKFGWRHGSRMPGVYQDLAAADLAKLKADMAGEDYDEKRKKAPTVWETKICENCTWENTGAANFCSKCGTRLIPGARPGEVPDAGSLIDELMARPDFWTEMASRLGQEADKMPGALTKLQTAERLAPEDVKPGLRETGQAGRELAQEIAALRKEIAQLKSKPNRDEE